MKAIKRVMCLIFVLALLVSGCVTTATTEKESVLPPVLSGDEAEVMAVLAYYERAWNEKDVKTVMEFFHPEAMIQTGRDKMMISKDEYMIISLARMNQAGAMTVKADSLLVEGNRATVKALVRFSNVRSRKYNFIFNFLRENGKWLISRSGFTT
jgi:hypothetical protein